MNKTLLDQLKANPHTVIRKQMFFKAVNVNEQTFTIHGIFSTGEVDRQGEIVKQDGWRLDEFAQNPVILFMHDPYQPAIGKGVGIAVNATGQLEGDIQFAADVYEFAKTIFNLYAGGYMRAFSVGFMNNQYTIDQENDVVILTDNTLLEISAVNVPANASALAGAKAFDLDALREHVKAAVPYADHGIAAEDAAWDGPAEVKSCGDDLAKLKAICAWYDAENADVKGSYKLPHHQADGLKAVWKGVSAAMAALLGSRGGVDIPEGDRKGVYNHLAKHYAAFEKEVPEFKAYTEDELKSIEENGFVPPVSEEAKAIDTISKSNIDTIKAAVATLTGIVATAETKGPQPAKKSGAISVNTLNKAIRLLLQVSKSETNSVKK